MSKKAEFALSTFLATSVAVLFGISQAQAHAALVTAHPAPNASVATPEMIHLQFDEALEAKLSSFKVTDVDGKPVAVMPMDAKDPKSLAAMPTKPLEPGLYTVTWTAVGDDSHKMTGKFSFTVK